MALLPSDPKQQRMLMIGLLPIVGLFAYWYFMHGGRTEEIDQLSSRLETLESKNAAARARAQAGGPELEERLALYEQHIARLEELVPSSEEVPELLHSMSLRAQETGVDLAKMTPADSTPGPYYTLQSYDIVVFGAYHDVGRFLTAVGSLPRIVTPVEVAITPRGRGGEGPAQVQSSFRIKTYVLPQGHTAPPTGEERGPDATT